MVPSAPGMDMRGLSSAALLDAWDRALGLGPLQRALTLLCAARADSLEAVAELTVGERDAQLLTLRERTFGPHLTGVCECPACGERLEFTFDVADIRAEPEIGSDELAVSTGEFQAHFRLPNSLDLAAIADGADVAEARQLLLARCLVAAHRGGRPCTADQLPATVVNLVADRMRQADPQGDMQLALTCAECGSQWLAAFDIATLFWDELNAWAHRTLREVHALASAYGWRETDILGLSPRRRQVYLQMISG
jgi:hypothetical protein